MNFQDFTPFEQELLGHLAHIEELTTQQIISIIKSILTAVGTGTSIDSVNDFYCHFYTELEKRFTTEGRKNPNPFSDLWEFHQYWKTNNLSTYAARRAYVAGLYKEGDSKNEQQFFWKLLHPDITAIAETRFNSGNYADSVEAAFKEINSRIKTYVKQKTGDELDGAKLMTTTFSPNTPIITLDDLSTEDGKNIQQGYMQIFAGSMIGIRNPKAHSNIVLTPEEATDVLFLASLLLKKFEAAIKIAHQEEPELSDDKRVYIRVINASSTKHLLEIKKIIDDNEGTTETILVLGADPSKQIIRLPNGMNHDPSVLKKLEKIVGVNNVRYY